MINNVLLNNFKKLTNMKLKQTLQILFLGKVPIHSKIKFINKTDRRIANLYSTKKFLEQNSLLFLHFVYIIYSFRKNHYALVFLKNLQKKL